MRLFSTRESIARQEPSVLALVETALAVGIGLYLSYLALAERQVFPLLFASAVSPLLLLKTQKSEVLGLILMAKYLRWWGYVDRQSESRSPRTRLLYTLAWILCLVGMPLGSLGIKFLATCYGLLRYPRLTLAAIPVNWRRMCLCIDTATLPEIVPGIERRYFRVERFPMGVLFRLSDMAAAGRLLRTEPLRDGIVTAVGLAVVGCLVIPLAALYRFSIKSTALFWFSLIWIFTAPAGVSLRAELTTVRNAAFMKLGRAVALVTLAVFAFKLALFQQVDAAATLYASYMQAEVVDALLDRHRMPKWQLAAAVNAAFAWLLYLVADYYVVQPAGGAVPGRGIAALFRTATLLRVPLGIYTSVCMIYVVGVHVARWNFPPLGDRWLPFW